MEAIVLPDYHKKQRTIKHSVSCIGVALHSGVNVSMTLRPAQANTGIVFRRTDVKQDIIARYDNVSNTQLCTVISNEEGVSVSTIEHVMAAMWGCGIDNCIIEIDSCEVPIMDGSSEPFVFLLECAGIEEHEVPRKVIEVLKTIEVAENGSKATIYPSELFEVSLEIDFGDKVISKQESHFSTNSTSFKNDVCRARTFGFEHEVEQMRSLGLAKGGSLDNAIVVGKDKILNKSGLRYRDEFVRHKVLDCIGDMYLAGAYIRGHVEGYKSGHAMNNKLLRTLFADQTAWRIVDLHVPASEKIAA